LEAPPEQDARLTRQLAPLEAGADVRFSFRPGVSRRETLELPSAVVRLLSMALGEMAQGNGVTLMPVYAELTTQEAADFINV
jgi:hypothetical protein